MKTYYELLHVTPKATPAQVQAVFCRYSARFRPTMTVEQIFTDTRFRDCVNAYLTLYGAERHAYDAALGKASGKEDAPPPALPRPYDALTDDERMLLMARIAYWRREMVEGIHLLRTLLERSPEDAAAWALLGEIYLAVGHLDDGQRAYQLAVESAPGNAVYAARLRHTQDAKAGKVALQIEPSPEQEMLREERKKRWLAMTIIALLGLAMLAVAYTRPLNTTTLGFLDIPWRVVAIQALGLAILFAALGYGRMLEPFERALVWSTTTAGDRGSLKNYPQGLLLLVLSVASIWVAVVGAIVMALMDDEWSPSTGTLLGVSVLVNVGLGAALYKLGLPWGYTCTFGGNLLVIAGMLGWWIGSLGTPEYS